MPVNVKLLKKVRKLIAEEPRRLKMNYWGIKADHLNLPPEQRPPCGTVACLAGWTVLASKPRHKWAQMFLKSGGAFKNQNGIPLRAARLLGINYYQCPFSNYDWEVPEVLAWIDRQIDAASAK